MKIMIIEEIEEKKVIEMIVEIEESRKNETIFRK